jgi:hypothetical protein
MWCRWRKSDLLERPSMLDGIKARNTKCCLIFYKITSHIFQIKFHCRYKSIRFVATYIKYIFFQHIRWFCHKHVNNIHSFHLCIKYLIHLKIHWQMYSHKHSMRKYCDALRKKQFSSSWTVCTCCQFIYVNFRVKFLCEIICQNERNSFFYLFNFIFSAFKRKEECFLAY